MLAVQAEQRADALNAARAHAPPDREDKPTNEQKQDGQDDGQDEQDNPAVKSSLGSPVAEAIGVLKSSIGAPVADVIGVLPIVSADDFAKIVARCNSIFNKATVLPADKIQQAGLMVWESVGNSQFLSVDQTETLLKLAPSCYEKYKWMNRLVAMCREPWRVGVDLGGCGVCYFGNLGDEPNDAFEAFRLWYQNRKALNSADQSSFW